MRVPNVERQILTPDQARQLRESYRGDRLEALYVIAMTLGLRQSEILALRWRDTAGGTLSVRQTLHRVGKQPTLEAPKTSRSRRDVPVTAEVAALLRARRRTQRTEYLATGVRPEHDLVFTTPGGSPLIGTTISNRLRARQVELALVNEEGRPRITFHDLRHIAATGLQARGFTLREAQTLLGHASVTTTANLYSHPDAAELARKMREVAW